MDDLPLFQRQRTVKEDPDLKTITALRASLRSQGKTDARLNLAHLCLRVSNPGVA